MDLDDKPRPTCNCKTSLCVQRYCHCFDNQWFCSDACRCSESCRNTQINEAFVEERIEITLRTKPRAFESKGCSCRKSECKKNYCECFKNRVACTERCKCEGCANTHGAEGGAVLFHNNGDSSGTCENSDGTSDGVDTSNGSNGSSNETAVITDEGSVSPSEVAGVKETVVAFGEPLSTEHVYTQSNSDPFAFYKSFPSQDCFQNVQTLMHQGPVQTLEPGSPNYTPQGLLNPNINSSSQDGPGGN